MGHRRAVGPLIAAWAVFLAGCASADPAKPQARVEQAGDETRLLTADGRPVTTYNRRPPAGTKLVVDSGDFFHPLRTPGGVTVTDLAPGDHPHHRGVFLGWVEMHGAKDADFWGWGEHAPIQGRRIATRSVTPTAEGLRAESDWLADGVVLIREELEAQVAARDGVHVLDLVYRLKPDSDLTLTRWAFSGFCLRTRKEGRIEFHSPAGPVSLPNPSHLKPESDWPDAAWYAATVTLEDGHVFTAAVLNAPGNPPTLWHNHRDVRMINPCMVAPGDVKLKAGAPLVLRYRVVTADGTVPADLLNRLAAEWRSR